MASLTPEERDHKRDLQAWQREQTLSSSVALADCSDIVGAPQTYEEDLVIDFVFYCGISRKESFVVKMKSSEKTVTAKRKKISQRFKNTGM